MAVSRAGRKRPMTKNNNTSPRKRRSSAQLDADRSAFHEAGHAVVMYHYCVELDWISTHITEDAKGAVYSRPCPISDVVETALAGKEARLPEVEPCILSEMVNQ